MNKLQIIDALHAQTGLTKAQAQAAIETFFGKMADSLSIGDRVEIRGLCSFVVKKYAPYSGRNPKTGEIIKVQAKRLPFFKAGVELRRRVDPGTNAMD